MMYLLPIHRKHIPCDGLAVADLLKNLLRCYIDRSSLCWQLSESTMKSLACVCRCGELRDGGRPYILQAGTKTCCIRDTSGTLSQLLGLARHISGLDVPVDCFENRFRTPYGSIWRLFLYSLYTSEITARADRRMHSTPDCSDPVLILALQFSWREL